jgi:methanogen extracellular protein (TIGR04279 family)
MSKLFFAMILISIASSQSGPDLFSDISNSSVTNNIDLMDMEYARTPHIIISWQEENGSAQYNRIYIQESDKNISGIYRGGLVNSTLSVGTAKINVSGIRDALDETIFLLNEVDVSFGMPVRADGEGVARFNIAGLAHGNYLLYLNNESQLLCTQPLIIAEEFSLRAPVIISSGDTLKCMVGFKIKEIDKAYYYAAILMPVADFENFMIYVNGNRDNATTNKTASITLSNSDASLNVPSTLEDFPLQDLFSIIPFNSAFAFQKATSSNVELYLMTDEDWPRGKYILTCAAYSPGIGIVGMGQEFINID